MSAHDVTLTPDVTGKYYVADIISAGPRERVRGLAGAAANAKDAKDVDAGMKQGGKKSTKGGPGTSPTSSTSAATPGQEENSMTKNIFIVTTD